MIRLRLRTARRLGPAMLVVALFSGSSLPAGADDCDPPPPAATEPDGPILFASTGSQSAGGTCTQYITSGPGTGGIRGLLCPNRKARPPHGVFIPPMGVVQGWNNCADAYPSKCP